MLSNTCTVDSISDISRLAGACETSVSVCTSSCRVTTSVVRCAFIDICVDKKVLQIVYRYARAQYSFCSCMLFVVWFSYSVYRLVRQYKLVYKPWALSMEEGDFRPVTAPRTSTDFDQTWNIQLPPGHDPVCKISGTMLTWVIWANSQFDA